MKLVIKTIGAPQSDITAVVSEIKQKYPAITFGITSSFGDGKIEADCPDGISQAETDEILRIMVTSLNAYIYALEDISLEERLFQLLKLRKMKISVAESFTGGGISKKLVGVPGISEVYSEGLTVYSNEAKSLRLGVQKDTLYRFGAVSEETAYQMTEGLLNSGYCDIAVATTGIAGPKSDNTNKPIGLAFIGVGIKGAISVYKYNFTGDREEITNTAINFALYHVFKYLK